MAVDFNFDQLFSQALQQGLQNRQRRTEQEALNSFRSRSLDMQRDDLNQRVKIQQQIRDLQRDVFERGITEFESTNPVVDDPERAAQLGVAPGTRVPIQSQVSVFGDPDDIPIDPSTREQIPGLPETIDPRFRNSTITALGQLAGIREQISRLQSDSGSSPEALRTNVDALQSRVTALGNELGEMGEFSPGYEAKLLEYQAAQRLLEIASREAIGSGVVLGQGTDPRIQELLDRIRELEGQGDGDELPAPGGDSSQSQEGSDLPPVLRFLLDQSRKERPAPKFNPIFGGSF